MSFLSSLDAKNLLTAADLLVFVLVLLLTIAGVVWGEKRKRQDSTDHFLDHLLMGRTLTLPLFTATLVATWYGGIFGVTEIAFKHGIYNFLTQGVFWYVTYIIFALFLVQKISRYQAVTLPELVGKMFGPRSARIAAVFNFFNVVPIAYSISLGLLLQVLFGWPVWLGTAAGTIFVCFYSMWGGFRAVVYSDLVQFFVMCLSVFLVVVFSAYQAGGSGFLFENLPPSHFEPLGGNGLATTLVWGFIALSTLVDPNFYQRCFAAENPKVARNGILVSTVIWCLFDLCTTLGGMYARAAIPDADPTQGYMLYALQILPAGLRGFFLAGVVATILSTLDSYIFIASNTLTYDLGPRGWRQNLWLHRASLFVVGCIAVSLSFFFDGSVRDVWKTLGSYSAGCLLFPVMVGYIKPGLLSDKAFFSGSLCGVIGITYWRFSERQGFWAEVDDLYAGLVCTMVGVTVASFLDGRLRAKQPA